MSSERLDFGFEIINYIASKFVYRVASIKIPNMNVTARFGHWIITGARIDRSCVAFTSIRMEFLITPVPENTDQPSSYSHIPLLYEFGSA